MLENKYFYIFFNYYKSCIINNVKKKITTYYTRFLYFLLQIRNKAKYKTNLNPKVKQTSGSKNGK